MPNDKYQITNKPRSSLRGAGESRSSVMGVDKCPNPNVKTRIRITNHEYDFCFSLLTSYLLTFKFSLLTYIV